jgi:hypothetical protein
VCISVNLSRTYELKVSVLQDRYVGTNQPALYLCSHSNPNPGEYDKKLFQELIYSIRTLFTYDFNLKKIGYSFVGGGVLTSLSDFHKDLVEYSCEYDIYGVDNIR